MTRSLYRMLCDWFAGDNQTKRFHAWHRLALPDASSYPKPAGYGPLPPDPLSLSAVPAAGLPPELSGVAIGTCCNG